MTVYFPYIVTISQLSPTEPEVVFAHARQFTYLFTNLFYSLLYWRVYSLPRSTGKRWKGSNWPLL